MAPSPRSLELPYRGRVRTPRFSVTVHSEVGLVRTRLEDAWAILPQATVGGQGVTALGVFDGLGGLAFGQEAAWAAADHLGEALTRSNRHEQVLAHLNTWVRRTQGATTAVVALFGPKGGGATLLSLGDSSAWSLGPDGAAQRVTPLDHEGENVVTRYLGAPEVDPHVTPLSLAAGAALLLCTDGVDGVLGPASLTRVLRAPDLGAALDDLFVEILDAGAPDNATVVAARRLA